MTTFHCYGHLEQREGITTIWEAYPIETMPNFVDWILPANGIFQGARYYLSVSVANERQDHDKYWDRYTSQIETRGVVDGDLIYLTDADVDPNADTYEGSAGSIGTIGLASDWEDGNGQECWITLSFQYDPGLTAQMRGLSRDDLLECQRRSEYATLESAPNYPTVELPDPEPESLPDRLTNAFPELGLGLDYSGVIEGGDTTLRLPMGCRHGFVVGETLVLLLEPGSEGVADPDVEIDDHRNVVGIGPDSTLQWTVPEPVDCDRPYRDLWVKDEQVMARADKNWYELDATTGTIENTVDHYYGRFD